ncbi:lipid-A-disaccharide synthase [Spirulina sp. CS-785/01]|uniref:lipid-A-disaccharide synthase n=1 Tax=Spirulina sp. CS-785/01 TaxID=3021716 RepID=UPI00232C2546|nr:lipid-A-disaccharide synthase [Spirulina sp. CS-785/01]MDB9312496.1 lipid-A-disaccharide synthase [Spirulina sp. CS-785/01]
MNKEFDLLILSNGPGEITTWVCPVVQLLRKLYPHPLRISVVLSPCPNASGREVELAQSYPEVDRVQGARYFWDFLLWGKTAEPWDWYDRGMVVFLGGDQLFSVMIGRRLGYPVVIYAEWEARWPRWVHRFAGMNDQVRQSLPRKYQHKCTIVGDLMADVEMEENRFVEDYWGDNTELIGLLPGSKAMKLTQGLPLVCAVAEQIHRQRPQTQFIIPVAPTLSIEELAKYCDRAYNPIIPKLGNVSAKLVTPPDTLPYLETSGGLQIPLWQEFPAYSILSQCRLCLTSIGANTAQLGALAVPMIVCSPTQQIDAMRAWDGLPGLLVNLPLVGTGFAVTINWLMFQYVSRAKPLFAWPNIWAKREIVPELVGNLTPERLAEVALNYLNHPETLQQMQQRLRSVRGASGAVRQFVELLIDEMETQ